MRKQPKFNNSNNLKIINYQDGDQKRLISHNNNKEVVGFLNNNNKCQVNFNWEDKAVVNNTNNKSKDKNQDLLVKIKVLREDSQCNNSNNNNNSSRLREKSLEKEVGKMMDSRRSKNEKKIIMI